MVFVFLGISFFIAAIWIFLLATGWAVPYLLTEDLIVLIRMHPVQGILFSFLIFLCGLYMLRKNISRFVTLTENENGDLKISYGAVKDTIGHCTSGITGFQLLRTVIRRKKEGLAIRIICRITAGQEINRLGPLIQEKVKTEMKQYLGINVTEVKILVQQTGFRWAVLRK